MAKKITVLEERDDAQRGTFFDLRAAKQARVELNGPWMQGGHDAVARSTDYTLYVGRYFNIVESFNPPQPEPRRLAVSVSIGGGTTAYDYQPVGVPLNGLAWHLAGELFRTKITVSAPSVLGATRDIDSINVWLSNGRPSTNYMGQTLPMRTDSSPILAIRDIPPFARWLDVQILDPAADVGFITVDWYDENSQVLYSPTWQPVVTNDDLRRFVIPADAVRVSFTSSADPASASLAINWVIWS